MTDDPGILEAAGRVARSLGRCDHVVFAAEVGPGKPKSNGREKVRAIVPLGRWQTPEDVAAMAVFLASPRAGNVTGQTISVAGGYVMHW